MNTLGKYRDTINNENEQSEFIMPHVYKSDCGWLNLKKSIVISTIFHPLSVGIICLITFIMALLGIKFDLLSRPETPKRDIEFVLVNNPEAEPINKNTKNRADRNTRAGGKHDPKKPEVEPSPAPGKPSQAVKQKQQPKKQQTPVKKAVPQPQPAKPVQQTTPAKPQPKQVVEQPAPKHVTPEPVAPAPRPAPVATAPKLTETPKSAMQVPVPKTSAPKLAGSYGGPVTGTKVGSGVSSGTAAGSSRPAPSFAPSSTSGASSNAGRFSGGQYGTGQAGNPSPGNPNGRPGIDAIKEPDFGPYMRELQRRIKMNWDPPKGNESKRVVLLFKIAKDGRLLSCRVVKTSGVQAADRAAISAVELTAPFKPLPPEFKGQSVDIQFTFDYNVFGASRY